MNKLKLSVIAFVAAIGIGAMLPAYAFAAPASQLAASPVEQIRGGVNDVGGSGEATPLSSRIGDIVNVMLYIVGILSVILIVYGGIRYATSAGDSSRTTAAKNTVMYAVIGLIVALVGYAIVNFVLNEI